MILESNKKQINLVLKTKHILTIANILKEKNFEKGFIKAYNSCDLDALSKIIYTVAEDAKGENPFNSSSDVLDFLDELRIDKKMTYYDVYSKIAEALNDEGFFKKKMKKEELHTMMSDPLSDIDMQELVKKSAENAMSNIAEKEMFKGYQA